MDPFNQKILLQLQTDSSLTNAQLSERVGLSAAACHRRVKALESAGIVKGYVAQLNPRALGLKTSVYISVQLESQRAEQLRRFEAAVASIPEVMECTLLAGTSDYLLRVIVRDSDDYQQLHADRLTALPHVVRLHSQFGLKEIVRRTALPV